MPMAPTAIRRSFLPEDGNAPSHFMNMNDNNNDDENGEVSALAGKELLCMLHPDYLKRLGCSNADADARYRAVSWIFKVQKYHRFGAETALLAVNYLDRFMSCTKTLERAKREWAMQLASVACLSLAAKMEETHVPLLLDLQVEEAEYVFDAGTVQRMELIILGALKWRMITVTPLSYIHHGTSLLGLQHCQYDKLFKSFILRCSEVAQCAVKDIRVLGFRPSVAAAAIMLCVVRETQALKDVECESRLLSGLKVDKSKVEDCHQLLVELLGQTMTWKRIACNSSSLHKGSPHAILDASFSCNSDNSIVNYALASPNFELSGAKKRRIGDFFPTRGSGEKAY